MDTAREHEERPAEEGSGERRRVLEKRDPDVQAAPAAGAFDPIGSGAAPRTGDYTSGAGAGFTGGAAGAVGARLGEREPGRGEEGAPAGGGSGGGYDSRAAADVEGAAQPTGAVNPGARRIA